MTFTMSHIREVAFRQATADEMNGAGRSFPSAKVRAYCDARGRLPAVAPCHFTYEHWDYNYPVQFTPEQARKGWDRLQG